MSNPGPKDPIYLLELLVTVPDSRRVAAELLAGADALEAAKVHMQDTNPVFMQIDACQRYLLQLNFQLRNAMREDTPHVSTPASRPPQAPS